MLKQNLLRLSAVLILVLVAGCASKPEPLPLCSPVKLPAWVLELSKRPSLIQPLDRIIEPYGPASSEPSKP